MSKVQQVQQNIPTSEEGKLAYACAKAVSAKKGEDILICDVTNQTVVCSYFVIASARNTSQVRAIGDFVEEEMKKQFSITPLRTEGLREGRWGVLDFGEVIVHIFNDESRLFYNLERLWDGGNNIVRYQEEQ